MGRGGRVVECLDTCLEWEFDCFLEYGDSTGATGVVLPWRSDLLVGLMGT